VSAAVHEARKDAHARFDPLWWDASSIYNISESPGTSEHQRAVKRIQDTARAQSYSYFSAMLDLPEAEVHMGTQSDVRKLGRISALADRTTPSDIRAWAATRCPCRSGRSHEECGALGKCPTPLAPSAPPAVLGSVLGNPRQHPEHETADGSPRLNHRQRRDRLRAIAHANKKRAEPTAATVDKLHENGPTALDVSPDEDADEG
jgi:hypothetical protein